jgi:hypothetical protein
MAKKATGKASKSKSRKYVYFFGSGKADGNRNMKDLLGGKGAGLAEMTNAGLPVPPGHDLTEVCNIYTRKSRRFRPTSTVDRRARESSEGRRGHADRPTIRCWSPSVPAPNSRCRA